jgi:hypothetical protein
MLDDIKKNEEDFGNTGLFRNRGKKCGQNFE